MASQRPHPSGIDALRPDPRPGIPRQLQASYLLWLVAVAAGLFETVLVVVDATDGDVGPAAEVAVGVAVRLLVFTGAVYLAAQLRQGRNWARVALAVLLGGIGTLSLVIGPATWLAEGGSLTDAVAAADLGSVLFVASRVVHLGAVIAALILMFHPAANAYIRATTRLPHGADTARQERRRSQMLDAPETQANTKPNPDLRKLDRLVGTWKITGGAQGQVTYQWMQGGFFLIQHVELEQYGQKTKGIEIIGHERPFGAEPSQDVTSRFYDSMGNTLDYVYELEGDTLTIWGGEKGSSAYYTGRFSDDGATVTGEWVYPGGGYHSTATRAGR